ncbi:MAG: rhombosortase [Kangiellaceae bacterium]|nr:rhombosortase [Kangiellaceae bacterium]
MKLNLLNLKETYQLLIASHWPTILITVVTAMIMLTFDTSILMLRYEKTAVNDGDLLRLFTANLCHSNWNHWILNIAGLWLMELFFKPVLSTIQRNSLLVFCMLGSVTFLHLFMNLTWYVGLSGALHGFLVGGAMLTWSTAKKLNSAILLIVVAKLFIEYFWQINQSTENLINANVIEEAHTFGALSAVIYFGLYLVLKKFQSVIE